MIVDQHCVAWITGGASGLGAACVTELRKRGATTLILDIDDKGADVARDLDSGFLHCDVTDTDGLSSVVEQGIDMSGVPRVLISCAGIAPAARTVSRKGAHDAALFQKTVAINLTGTYLLSSVVAEKMSALSTLEDGERGVIINTASVAAFDGQVGQCAYAASKAAVAGLTLPMARDLASLGIRVCSIAPGIFSTPMLSAMPQEVQDSLASQVPFPSRLGKPGEFADLATHIIENTMLNGEVIRLDGAIRMSAR